MPTHGAELWTSPVADGIALEIASIGGVYCGPAAIAWIAAVWNAHRGRSYDYRARLRDKGLFPDGPRLYRGRLPFFADEMDRTLRRETEHELGLSRSTYRRTKSMHRALERFGMPIVLRMKCPSIWQGLHYTTLFRSSREDATGSRILFEWMDNGLYGMGDPGHPAFFSAPPARAWSFYMLGCKRVVELER